jgi:hypothetical protein
MPDKKFRLVSFGKQKRMIAPSGKQPQQIILTPSFVTSILPHIVCTGYAPMNTLYNTITNSNDRQITLDFVHFTLHFTLCEPSNALGVIDVLRKFGTCLGYLYFGRDAHIDIHITENMSVLPGMNGIANNLLICMTKNMISTIDHMNQVRMTQTYYGATVIQFMHNMCKQLDDLHKVNFVFKYPFNKYPHEYSHYEDIFYLDWIATYSDKICHGLNDWYKLYVSLLILLNFVEISPANENIPRKYFFKGYPDVDINITTQAIDSTYSSKWGDIIVAKLIGSNLFTQSQVTGMMDSLWLLGNQGLCVTPANLYLDDSDNTATSFQDTILGPKAQGISDRIKQMFNKSLPVDQSKITFV